MIRANAGDLSASLTLIMTVFDAGGARMPYVAPVWNIAPLYFDHREGSSGAPLAGSDRRSARSMSMNERSAAGTCR